VGEPSFGSHGSRCNGSTHGYTSSHKVTARRVLVLFWHGLATSLRQGSAVVENVHGETSIALRGRPARGQGRQKRPHAVMINCITIYACFFEVWSGDDLPTHQPLYARFCCGCKRQPLAKVGPAIAQHRQTDPRSVQRTYILIYILCFKVRSGGEQPSHRRARVRRPHPLRRRATLQSTDTWQPAGTIQLLPHFRTYITPYQRSHPAHHPESQQNHLSRLSSPTDI
jgi:hypothetical protein